VSPIPRRTGRLTVGRKINSTQVPFLCPVCFSPQESCGREKYSVCTVQTGQRASRANTCLPSGQRKACDYEPCGAEPSCSAEGRGGGAWGSDSRNKIIGASIDPDGNA
jgi:hypothetical protein